MVCAQPEFPRYTPCSSPGTPTEMPQQAFPVCLVLRPYHACLHLAPVSLISPLVVSELILCFLRGSEIHTQKGQMCPSTLCPSRGSEVKLGFSVCLTGSRCKCVDDCPSLLKCVFSLKCLFNSNYILHVYKNLGFALLRFILWINI